MLKLVREIGSGDAGEEQNGDKIVSVVVIGRLPVVTPLEPFGKKGQTRHPRRFGIPLLTRNEKVPGATLEKL
jgi:hypothetical protein